MLSTWSPGATAPSRDPVVHLLKRFTYGPTKELVTEVKKIGIDKWFDTQLDPGSINDSEVEEFLSNWEMFNYIHKDVAFLKSLAESESSDTAQFNTHWMAGRTLNLYSVVRQARSKRQIFEMMVNFWHTLINISTIGDMTKNDLLDWHTNDWNANVIRRNALGNFEDLIQYSALHPAMVVYLDGELSTKEVPNENYGRELLELHTVAPKAGYTQADVLDASKLFSGIRVKWPQNFYGGPLVQQLPEKRTLIDIPPFPVMLHVERQNFGRFKVMGWQRTVNSAAEVLPAIKSLISYLCNHPETGKTIALKLGRRFVEDVPSKKFIDDVAATFTSTKGDIKSTLKAVYRHPDFQSSMGKKLKRPGEDYVSVARALDVLPNFDNLGKWPGRNKDYSFVSNIIKDDLHGLDHVPLGWHLPDGYSDVSANWVNANSQVLRWNSYGNFIKGGSWKKPNLSQLFPSEGKDLDSHINQISQALLFTELGSADLASVKSAVLKRFSQSELDLGKLNIEVTSLVVRLILQLPVWSLR